VAHIEIQSRCEDAQDAAASILTEVDRLGWNEDAVFAVRLATEEALMNAIRHGNGFDESKMIQIDYDVSEDAVEITITDEGKGFDDHAVPDPTQDENLEKPCGRGVMLIRAFMDSVEYRLNGRQICMIKRRNAG
jgi:serine/threonine-protein kinase RsbW